VTDIANCWVSLEDVTNLAGATATSAQVILAQTLIEGLINRNWRETDVNEQDYYWLKRAVAWQSRHVVAHPEILDQVDLQSLSQDGFSVTFRDTNTGGVHPLYSHIAVSFLNNMRQGANTSLRVNSAFQGGRRVRSRGRMSSGFPGWQRIGR
jgi:hypothetical protein